MVAVERRVLSAPVPDRDADVLVARGQGQGQPLGDVERVGDVDAHVLLPGVDVHRRLEPAGAQGAHARALRHELRLRLALAEARLVAIVGHPGGHPVAVAEDLPLVRQLQRAAPVPRAGARGTVLARGLTLEGAGERIAGAVEEADRRAAAAPQVEEPATGVEHFLTGGVVEAGDLGVAVERAAVVVAVERVRGEQHVLGELVAAMDGAQMHLVAGPVGEGVHRAVIAGQGPLRHQAVAHEVVVDVRVGQAEGGARGLHAHPREDLPQLAR